MQSQKGVAAYLKSKQLLPFGFAELYTCTVRRAQSVIYPPECYASLSDCGTTLNQYIVDVACVLNVKLTDFMRGKG